MVSFLIALVLFGSGFVLSFILKNPIPQFFRRIATLYLVFTIGWKGGVAIAEHGANQGMLWTLGLAGVGLGFLQPFIAYFFLRLATCVDRLNACAISAHYGSVSLITFVTAVGFIESLQIPYQGVILAVLAIMEVPAIVSGLLMARWFSHEKSALSRWKVAKDILTHQVILLLILAMGLGCVMHKFGQSHWMDLPLRLFPYVLGFFLFDMGMLVARQKEKLRKLDLRLLSFGIYMPLVGAFLGAGVSGLIGLDLGTGLLFTVLAASASYIAVPAVLRLCLPKADEALYFPLSMGVTFPFNVTIGIPLYYRLATLFLS